MNSSPEVHDNLPLTEVTYFILLSLAPGPKHGYAIMKDVRQMSHGRLTLSTGTLYGALPRLLELGLIEPSQDDRPTHSGRVRKQYRLTALGTSVLKAEVRRLDSLVTAAQQRSVGGSL